MICMYLPPQGQDGVECRFIVDNVKDKTEKDGKYNNDDERLSRDLKKHNWLMNKLKDRFDVSDAMVPEKNTTPAEGKEAKKPQRVGRRRHSIAIPTAKCKSTQSSEEDSNKESQKVIDVHSDCEIIDYSLKKTTKDRINGNQQTSPDRIYDLSKTKCDHGIYYQKNESQSKIYTDHVSSDMVYDLRRNKNTCSEKVIESHDVIHTDTEEPVKYFSHWSKPNIDSNSIDVLSTNLSDLRKLRRVEKNNISDHDKKNTFTVNVDDSSEQNQNKQIIKHNLPFGILPRREKNIRIQSPVKKDNETVDISVQTEEIFTVSKDDWNLLNYIKSKGIAEDKIWRCSQDEKSESNKNYDSPNYYNLSDVDSDNENGVINIHILRKLLEQSEKNKNILNKTYNLSNKSQSNSEAHEPNIKNYNYENKKEITKVFDILMSEYDQRLINDKRQSVTERDIWHDKRRKLHNPIVPPNENNYDFGQNKSIEPDNVSALKKRPFVPQILGPTRPQIYHYPFSWSRQSVSPYETENIFQLPYQYQQRDFTNIEALNRKANPVYDHREYPQIPQRLRHCTPRHTRHLSPYTSQQINYLDLPRTEPKVHYGPIQQNNQYINLRGAESPHRPHALHPMSCRDKTIHLKPQRTTNGRLFRQDEDLFQESRFRDSEAQKLAWESEITNYPNTDWSGPK